MKLLRLLNCSAAMKCQPLLRRPITFLYVEVTFVDEVTGVSCSGEESFTRTYTATDACGNTSSVSVDVTFNDQIVPTFTAPMDVTIECDSDVNDLALTGNVMDAADVCSADISVTYSDAVSTSEGSCLADNVITRTWTVTDGCGNVSSGDADHHAGRHHCSGGDLRSKRCSRQRRYQ